MATEVRLPELGENVTQADVVRILVGIGDSVATDQSILEIENEKASVEVPAPLAGTVASIAVQQGQTIEVGALLMTIEAAETTAAPEPDEEAGATDDQREQDEETPSGEEATASREAAGDGEEGPDRSTAPAGPARPSASAQPPDRPAAPSPALGDGRVLVPAAPTVRRFAREIGVDLARVKGTGPGGRISIDDVKTHAKEALRRGAAGAPSTLAAPAIPDLAAFGEVEREPVSSVRRLTAQAMARAWNVVPHVTHHDHADITELEAARQRHASRAEAAGAKLTVTAMLVKVVAAALKRYPKFNAALDLEQGEVVYRRYVNVGVAVDTDRGLLVPVVRDADRKTLLEVAVELKDLAGRARARRIGPDEMQGAGFSISNLGGIGGDAFTPIVNWPEVAVLGVSRSSQQPTWNGETFVPRLILPLSLSYDHRLVDGADAARFLRWVCEALEEPMLVALGG